ncbi:CLUMA_CG008338, isoform A [Clunio marinus]|uniref:CLUMA_CG008338, isoform A n=1 Tax=Clunio marinus TaxID=568069 RepID=A0A1J1I7B7_9DIPT|nr:CLUMA_CG008338, isoform A [Clunio marinus]
METFVCCYCHPTHSTNNDGDYSTYPRRNHSNGNENDPDCGKACYFLGCFDMLLRVLDHISNQKIETIMTTQTCVLLPHDVKHFFWHLFFCSFKSSMQTENPFPRHWMLEIIFMQK